MTCELPAYSPANYLRTLCAHSPYNPQPVSRLGSLLPGSRLAPCPLPIRRRLPWNSL